jgi:hypothetical protein
VGVQDASPRYEFSNAKTYRLVWALVTFLDVAFAAGLLATHVTLTAGHYISILLLLILFASVSVGARYPSTMKFFEDYVKISDLRTRKPKDIPYSQISKVVTYKEDDRTGYTTKVAFHVFGEARSYEIPKPSPHQSILDSNPDRVDPFIIWFQEKTRHSEKLA